ncbi:TPA: BlaI/MecI/CopY family transcriptional regulator, partial [Staphylococcus aureus]
IVHTEDSFLLKLYYKFNFATEPKKEIIKRYKSENIYFYSSNIKEDDIKMKTAKTFLNKLYGGDMKSLVLNFAKNEELNNKEIEELRDILNDISKK